MGIRFSCPSGHKLNVKDFLAGKRGVCPHCGAKFVIPTPAESQPEDAPLAATGGQVQPLDNIAAGQISSVVASPSIIITIADANGLSSVAESHPPTVTETQAAPDVNPPSNLDALPESVLGTEPAEVPEPSTLSATGPSRGIQFAISIALFTIVIVLAFVLVWVLNR